MAIGTSGKLVVVHEFAGRARCKALCSRGSLRCTHVHVHVSTFTTQQQATSTINNNNIETTQSGIRHGFEDCVARLARLINSVINKQDNTLKVQTLFRLVVDGR